MFVLFEQRCMDENEKRILDSWRMNALLWTQAIREQQIESRAIATDAAIVKTVSQLNPRTFLDIGCGEGWLSRQLFSLGIDGWGVDFCADLIEAARHSGDSRFVVCSYSDLASQRFSTINSFSCFICNFSILGESALDEIAKAGHSLLEDKGKIIIQTLHPIIACGDSTYSNGWRETSWQAISDQAFYPTPWYFRTLESWINEFHAWNYRLLNLYEPCHPKTNKPISIIFVFERQ
ncbi:class I SAM-dependent methyltransferase [Nostoc sp. DedQUE03]|uniref:class I SAM-dependent methyltransferase n=2 Tax=unclassified Nostoc TaxID=2593658 RepID=UPI002AD6F9E6|nr:class I SAM-dependent methyltransferase [Nostoc sp. DedQUE03]MDZ8049724.1 class I SAM-dependent methyltransferase [Nostoc sp. DedQUE02]